LPRAANTFAPLLAVMLCACDDVLGMRRHSSNTTTTTLTVLLSNMSATRLSIQPQPGQQQQQQMEMECRRVETSPTTLELIPHAYNGSAAREENTDPAGSSPRRPDIVKFTIVVDSA